MHAQAGPGAGVDGGAARFLLFMGGVSSCRRDRRGVVGARAARLILARNIAVVFYRVYTRERTLTQCQKPVIKPVSQAAGWLLLGHAACALSQRSGRVNAAAPCDTRERICMTPCVSRRLPPLYADPNRTSLRATAWDRMPCIQFNREHRLTEGHRRQALIHN